eukprot:1785527-Rhodomonas_salina.1
MRGTRGTAIARAGGRVISSFPGRGAWVRVVKHVKPSSRSALCGAMYRPHLAPPCVPPCRQQSQAKRRRSRVGH